MIGHITLTAKRTGEPTARNLHGGFDEAGAGNAEVLTKPKGAPVLDPTSLSFKLHLFAGYLSVDITIVEKSIPLLKNALNTGNIEEFVRHLQVLFAHIPFNLHIPQERYYHSHFQFLLTLLGINADSEVVTDKGKIDLVMQTEDYIYVCEIKLDGTPREALKQIEERKYYEKFLLKNKKIFLVGFSFNTKHKRLTIGMESKALSDML